MEDTTREYPTEPQIEEMFKALKSGNDQEVLKVLRKRKLERQDQNPMSPTKK